MKRWMERIDEKNEAAKDDDKESSTWSTDDDHYVWQTKVKDDDE